VWPPGGTILVLTAGAAAEEEIAGTGGEGSEADTDSEGVIGLVRVTSVGEVDIDEAAGVVEASGSGTEIGPLISVISHTVWLLSLFS
jgi:hypothetical protein